MINDNSNSETISQNHSGAGDNVAGDKNVFQAISPTELHVPIQNILTSLRHRQPLQAREQHSTLEATANLNLDAKVVLGVVNLLIQLAEDSPPSNTYQELNSTLRTSGNDLCRDLAVSAQIRYDAKNGNTSDACQRYTDIDTPGQYTSEAYFEFAASINDIEGEFNDHKLQLSDIELCGLVRGALRSNNFEQAAAIAEYLNIAFPSFNSRVLLTVSQISLFDSALTGRHYWSITGKQREELLSACDAVVELLSECEGKDSRVINQAAMLLQYVLGEHEHLSDICRKYITEIESLLPEVAERILYVYGIQPLRHEGVYSKLEKAKTDPSYRQEVITEITSTSDITVEDYTLLSNFGDKTIIQQWIDAGGKVSVTDNIEADYASLNLQATACNGEPGPVEELRLQGCQFINDHKAQLKSLYPPTLLDLSDKLLALGLPSIVCELLKPLIPDHDLWVSPIVRCYLHALLESQQMMTLNSTLSEIDQSRWNAEIWQIKAKQLDRQHDYEDAIKSIEKAIALNPLSVYNWYLLLYLIKKADSKAPVKEVLDRIPEEIFSRPSELGYSILAEMVVGGDFSRAEAILIRWFIADPEGCSIPFTNVYLNFITTGIKSAPLLSDTVGDCMGGIRYSLDGKEVVKLLVSDVVVGHHTLLAASSPLGRLLSEMSIGDTSLHNMSDIKLLERLPPYIAAFNIASTLRQAINDGTDCFYSFSLPDDPDEMISSLERKLLGSDGGKDEVDSMPNVPLFMKGFRKAKLFPVKTAFSLLTDKSVVKSPLPAFGEVRPDQVILDVYSVAYLALTGLSSSILCAPIQTVVTTETKHYLEEWLRDLNRDDYMSVGVRPGGGLYRNTAEDVQRETGDLQAAINQIIDKSEVITPNLVDLPPDALRVNDVVDLSIFSSFKLSITNDIPWLCIDFTFAQLSKASGYKVANANQLINILGNGLSIEEKRRGLFLHATAGLPYSLTFEDMIQLSRSQEDLDHYVLAELLQMYPNAHTDTGTAVRFLHQVLVSILINAYKNGEILQGLSYRNPRNNGYAERIFNTCCYVSMQCQDNQKAEYKLAWLLADLLYTFRDIDSISKIILHMASRFAMGHFMSIPAIENHLSALLSEKAVVESGDTLSNDRE